jgi:hypothetical protein
MIIHWMRNREIVDCAGIVSGLHDLCAHVVGTLGKRDSVMYEIGSFAGESAEVFAKYFGVVHCVDPWTSDPNICGLDDRATFNCEDVQSSFDERAAIAGNMIKHVGYSLEVAKEVKDDSLSFVYIDGAHDYDSVKADIEAWLPKVEIGAFIGGHDYHSNAGSDFHVQLAVDEMVVGGKVSDLVIFSDTSWCVRRKA